MFALLSALAMPAFAQSTDYSAGYQQGQLDAQVDSGSHAEWACYSGCATCVAGPQGCIGVTVAGALIDPEVVRPLGDNADVPSNNLGTVPLAPAGIQDPTRWQEGYEEGWDDSVQDQRKRMALIGGGVSAGVMVAAVASYYVFAFALVLATV